ncbi:hypothetical protein [Larkinella humicola]|uniref:Esterase n=1 Tax=Larkinella humicola TaxID=2607654 RepID=A0A5N1J1T3_9BACT|nr:hypothetical protein [Larkinella humicola]KAA9340358.1 hypothetical protein F0P93_31285 [Larkinella humicola]
MKWIATFSFILGWVTTARAQNDSAAVYNDRAFVSYQKNEYANCLYWTEKLFATGPTDYQNNYNFYRASVSACQVGKPDKALLYYTKMANSYLDYSNYPTFAQDSSKLACITGAPIWKKSMAAMRTRYDSVQTLNQLYFQGITDTTKRLNRSPLLSQQFLNNLFNQNSFDQIYQTLRTYNRYETPPVVNHWTLYHIAVNDTLTVPFLVYIPKEYKPNQRTPLYLFLQGAVRGRPDFMIKGRVPISDAAVLSKAREAGAFILYPFARKDVNWLYHPVAFEAIRKEIAFVKSLYNIDDNRVYLTGHSNGGEGAFYMAINQPTPFASFLAFTYFPQSFITNTPLRNLTNSRTFFGATAKNDHIFPYATVDSIYTYAKSMGAHWQNYSFEGNHTLPYSAQKRVSFVYDSLFSKVRNPFAHQLRWEVDNVQNGRYDWIEINELDTTVQQSSWVDEYTPSIRSTNQGRAGFNPRRSGVIEASVTDNEIRIRTSRVRRFSFYVYPELLDVNRPLRVIINDRPARQVTIKKQKSDLKAAYLHSKDRVLLPYQKIIFQVR